MRSPERARCFVEADETVACVAQRFERRRQRLELAAVGNFHVRLVLGKGGETVAYVEHVDAVQLEVHERFAEHRARQLSRGARTGKRERGADEGQAHPARYLNGNLEKPTAPLPIGMTDAIRTRGSAQDVGGVEHRL